MAFFKFRKRSHEPSAVPAQAESIDAMRKRAKYRLIGAAVLVMAGVIGFPMLFDKQPRPIALNTPITIPDKNKVAPLSVPAPAAMQAGSVTDSSPVVAAVPAISPTEIIEEKEAPAPAQKAPEAIENIVSEAAKPVAKEPEKVTEKAAVRPATKSDEAAKAQALLDGATPAKKPDVSEGRFVVQVGAFADAVRAREVRLKVERAGLKTYTHVAQTKDGERIRVRVGPFGTKAEADKAADKIKKLALPAAVLTL
jgi:DedD protein